MPYLAIGWTTDGISHAVLRGTENAQRLACTHKIVRHPDTVEEAPRFEYLCRHRDCIEQADAWRHAATLALLDEVEKALDSVVDDMATLIQEHLPTYSSLTMAPEVDAQWRAGLRRAFELFLALQRRPTGALDRNELGEIETIGWTRADQRVELPVVLSSVLLAMHAALSALGSIARTRFRPTAAELVEDVSLRMTAFVNDFSTAVSRGYFTCMESLVAERERERSQLFGDLLTGRFTTYVDATRAADDLGTQIDPRFGLLLVPFRHSKGAFFVAEVRREQPASIVVPMTFSPVPHYAVLVPMDSEVEWANVLRTVGDSAARHRLTVCDGGVLEVPLELQKCYEQLSTLLVAAVDSPDSGWVTSAEKLLPDYLIAQAPVHISALLERRVLEPLRAKRQKKKLLATLDALFDARATAKSVGQKLGVSDKTARGYLEDIEAATGLLFDRPADVMWLGLAGLFERRRRASPP